MITQDFNQWIPFLATVEDVNDPKMLGRCKLRVINHDESVTTQELDWATPIIPNSASKQGIGTSPTFLELGSMVVGFYLDGHMRSLPLILGAFAKIPGGDEKKHDVHERARGINSLKLTQAGPEPKIDFGAKYPFNKVFSTHSGHVIELDDTPGAERINLLHKSGSYVQINNTGQVVIKSVNDQYTITQGKQTIYSAKDMALKTDGKMNINVAGTFDLNVKGNVKLTSSSLITFSAPVVNLQG